MTLTLAAASTLQAVAGSATAVTYNVFGDEISAGPTNTFKKLAQGQLAASAGVIYTVPGSTATIVKDIQLVNTTGAGVAVTMYVDGTAAANSIGTFTIPAGGQATWSGNGGWTMRDSSGATISTGSPISATGDATGTQTGTTLPLTLATVGTAGTNGTASSVPVFVTDTKGRVTANTNTPIAITSGQVSGLGSLATVSNLTGPVTSTGAATAVTANAITNAMLAQMPASTLKGNNAGVTNNAVDLTSVQVAALLPAATTGLQGMMSATDKVKINTLDINGLTNWVDVTKFPSTPCLPANTAAANVTAINAILAASPAGATIYFPAGTYQFNAAWTMPAGKQFTFQGQGFALTGGNTIIQFTANIAGDIITLASATWYYQFNNLNFSTTVNQTAGALININGNVSTNFFNCSTSSQGGFFNDVLYGAGGGSGQSWNTASINNCLIGGYKGRGVLVDSAGASLVISESVIQGAWGGFGAGTPSTLQALAGVQANNSGAVQLLGCDVLGNVNNVLLSPAVGQVNASFFCANTYFDNSAGSCIKIAGAGATVRVIFIGCSFTTAGTNYATAGTALSAVEIGGSFAYGAGGQSISFTDCNIFNTFGTTGTTNGVVFTGTSADSYFTGCKVAGWTNGYNIAASGTNLTFPKISGGACGPSGGYGANTTGFNVAAGAYKGLTIQGVNAHGNTTNLTLGAVTVAAADASLFRIADNTGINPRGSVTTPGVPTAGTTVTNTTGFRVNAMCKFGATASTAVLVNSVSAGVPVASSLMAIPLDPGGTLSFTTTTIASWVWVAN